MVQGPAAAAAASLSTETLGIIDGRLIGTWVSGSPELEAQEICKGKRAQEQEGEPAVHAAEPTEGREGGKERRTPKKEDWNPGAALRKAWPAQQGAQVSWRS